MFMPHLGQAEGDGIIMSRTAGRETRVRVACRPGLPVAAAVLLREMSVAGLPSALPVPFTINPN